MFALHYFSNETVLDQFVENVAECNKADILRVLF